MHELGDGQRWIKGIEKIFQVVICLEEQKVQFGTHVLEEEAEE